jgi:transcriptional regulator with XRE-family HTH domain
MASSDHRSKTNPLGIDQGRTRSQALWRHIGQRMRLRRTQLRLEADAAARKLGVTPQTYAQYESGELQTPAMLLSDAAQLFRLPVTWFFQDLSFDEPAQTAGEEQGVFAVATDEERIQTLTDYFRGLDLEGQQHVLLVARTLFRARKEGPGSRPKD